MSVALRLRTISNFFNNFFGKDSSIENFFFNFMQFHFWDFFPTNLANTNMKIDFHFYFQFNDKLRSKTYFDLHLSMYIAPNKNDFQNISFDAHGKLKFCGYQRGYQGMFRIRSWNRCNFWVFIFFFYWDLCYFKYFHIQPS